MAIQTVQRRLRERAVDAKLDEIKELLNREHSPTITEIRTRFNELLAALNPGAVQDTTGAPSGKYLQVTVDNVDYVIALNLPT